MVDITLHKVADLAALEAPWRELEKRANGSFFQGWTWVGCLAQERYDDPVLLRAEAGGRVVALALCNDRAAWPGRGPLIPRRLMPRRLHLGETGYPDRDAVFVEHNGPLMAAGSEALLAPVLAKLLTAPLAGRIRHGRALVLSGVGEPVRLAAASLPVICRMRQSRPAPFVDLAAVPARDFADTLGASTRYQLRRSAKRYAATGALAVRRAASVAEGLDYLDALVALHQATWAARDRPGAFADPAIMRFHRTLVERGLPRGEIDLLRVSAGERVVGYLYNMLSNPVAARRWVGNYQGGFDYATAEPHCKPGLTCHHLAIEFYRRESRHTYDLLAGESRYKSSLTSTHVMLHWLDIVPRASGPGLLAVGLEQMRRLGGYWPRAVSRAVIADRFQPKKSL